MNSSVISLDAAVAITQISRRTWWRRITAQVVSRGVIDRGRAMLLWSEVAPHIEVPIDAEMHESLLLADMGSADAQNTVGQFFYIQESIRLRSIGFNSPASRTTLMPCNGLGTATSAEKEWKKTNIWA